MNSNTTTVLDSLREMTYFALANNVSDIAGPDGEGSPGAVFLGRVRDSVIESLEWKVENDDVDLATAAAILREDSHELADGAVPVYTHERWQTFVDLAAYQVDVSEYGESEDMTEQAGVALYEVARMLTDALCEYVETYYGELEDDEDEDEDEEQDDTQDQGLDPDSAQ